MLTVRVHLKETAQEIVHNDVKNTYQKGDFFCVYCEKVNKVYKYPVASIFRVVEDYKPV